MSRLFGRGRAVLAVFVLLVALTARSAAAQEVRHVMSSEATQARIEELIASDDRPDEQKARDQYRHPLETLTFFGIEPGMTVVELWPGGQGGYYRRIIEPLIGDEGRYIPIDDRDPWPEHMDVIPYGEVDMVLVFRAHGFVHPPLKEEPQVYVDALYEMLRPGGIFGIVDHAGDEAVEMDPDARHGYVNESYFFMMAKRAGFNILAASDVNRNPQDTKHHPRGVYSLPPTLWTSDDDPEEGEEFYKRIGESDRFTHKYYKPYPAPMD